MAGTGLPQNLPFLLHRLASDKSREGQNCSYSR
ncbi:hypothetical protein ES319_A09G025100v1 [Gossypium barbadense]|uniref:Uncharacterized protein n=2 Tax=Gossypium TaxID=3633 RepID=A0A5J5U9Z8_GOSBA|nr:hypothetical protein ES319_A09G025100v1 [Gossypium barbadense]TYH01101.1 hypothetical protein ES288_A09G030300v1 [Gossypium darwinii]